jgi:hypothetical protein
MRFSVVVVENDLPIVFVSCIVLAYCKALVWVDHSIEVGSGPQQELPMLVVLVLVVAYHQPEILKTICHMKPFNTITLKITLKRTLLKRLGCTVRIF